MAWADQLAGVRTMRDAMNDPLYQDLIAQRQAQAVTNLIDYQYISEWPAGVYPGQIDHQARAAAMARHPAGKGRVPTDPWFREDGSHKPDAEWERENNKAPDALLAAMYADPDHPLRVAADQAPALSAFEEKVHDTLFQLATLIVEASRG